MANPVVNIRGRSYPEIPHTLTLCPHCGRASLEWDGRGAWRCTYVYGGSEPRPCRYGMALGALFESADLEVRLSTGRVDFASLRLTPLALLLAVTGKISLPWLTFEEIARRQAEQAGLEDQDAELTHLNALIRQGPRHKHWVAGLSRRLGE